MMTNEHNLKKIEDFQRRFLNPTAEEKEEARKKSKREYQERQERMVYYNRINYYPQLTFDEHHIQYTRFLEHQKDNPNLTFDEFLDDYASLYGYE